MNWANIGVFDTIEGAYRREVGAAGGDPPVQNGERMLVAYWLAKLGRIPERGERAPFPTQAELERFWNSAGSELQKRATDLTTTGFTDLGRSQARSERNAEQKALQAGPAAQAAMAAPKRSSARQRIAPPASGSSALASALDRVIAGLPKSGRITEQEVGQALGERELRAQLQGILAKVKEPELRGELEAAMSRRYPTLDREARRQKSETLLGALAGVLRVRVALEVREQVVAACRESARRFRELARQPEALAQLAGGLGALERGNANERKAAIELCAGLGLERGTPLESKRLAEAILARAELIDDEAERLASLGPLRLELEIAALPGAVEAFRLASGAEPGSVLDRSIKAMVEAGEHEAFKVSLWKVLSAAAAGAFIGVLAAGSAAVVTLAGSALAAVRDLPGLAGRFDGVRDAQARHSAGVGSYSEVEAARDNRNQAVGFYVAGIALPSSIGTVIGEGIRPLLPSLLASTGAGAVADALVLIWEELAHAEGRLGVSLSADLRARRSAVEQELRALPTAKRQALTGAMLEVLEEHRVPGPEEGEHAAVVIAAFLLDTPGVIQRSPKQAAAELRAWISHRPDAHPTGG